MSLLHKSISVGTINYISPNIMQNESSLSTGFHNVPLHTAHFFEGVNLTGGIPLVEQMGLLGVLSIATAGPLLVM